MKIKIIIMTVLINCEKWRYFGLGATNDPTFFLCSSALSFGIAYGINNISLMCISTPSTHHGHLWRQTIRIHSQIVRKKNGVCIYTKALVLVYSLSTFLIWLQLFFSLCVFYFAVLFSSQKQNFGNQNVFEYKIWLDFIQFGYISGRPLSEECFIDNNVFDFEMA